MHDCKQDKVLEIILENIKEIKHDVKEIKEYRDKMIGAIIVISGALSIVITTVLNIFFRR